MRFDDDAGSQITMKPHHNQIVNQTVKGNGVGHPSSKINLACGASRPQDPTQGDDPCVAPAYYIGRWKGTNGIEDFDLYNLTEEIPGHPQGSTVSGKTLEAAGFQLRPLVPNDGHERALAQIRRLQEISSLCDVGGGAASVSHSSR